MALTAPPRHAPAENYVQSMPARLIERNSVVPEVKVPFIFIMEVLD